MELLRPGCTVYFVFYELSATKVNRRRTSSERIAALIDDEKWPFGAQAHIGTRVLAGDVCPAIVVRIAEGPGIVCNLKVMLDGSDTYWARLVDYSAAKEPGTWHWVFEGRYVTSESWPSAPIIL